jgi:hypothetical protein
MVVKTSSAGVVTPSQQFKAQQQASSTATVKTPIPTTPVSTAPVTRKGEQGGTTSVTSTVTTPAKPVPVVTPSKPAATSVPRTSAQIQADAAAAAKLLETINANFATIESNLNKTMASYGFSYDANGNVVEDANVVVSSTYVGTGKDRQRIDTMKNGTKRTFADPDLTVIDTPVGTTDIDVLKAVMKSKGIPATLVDNSVSFLTSLKKEGLDNNSIVNIYLNNKDFTTSDGLTITSPFYTAYGFYNDKLTDKYTAADLFATVEGYKAAATKYDLGTKFTGTDYIQKYLSNKLSVEQFDFQANQARLLAVTSDPDRVKALQDLGYITTAQDLTDFYLDPNVGTEKMKQNVNTTAMAIEAIRRSNAATGIKVDTEAIKKYGAELTAKGLSEAQVSALASQGYQQIAATLAPETRLSGIYEGQNAGNAATIQSELETEQFRGLESERRKRLTEQEQMAFKAQSGITRQSLSKGPITGQF